MSSPASVGMAMRRAVARLKAAGIAGAQNDVRVLMAAALGVDRGRLVFLAEEPLCPETAGRFADFVMARLARRPVSQIIGRREFFGRRFRVTADVLDPRPETETLVEAALSGPFERVLDLGTGSGAILLTLLAENPTAEGLGTDISPAALSVARENSSIMGIDRAKFILSDWYEAVRGRFDLIVSNPPYIPASELAALPPEVRDHEPRMALSPGNDSRGDGLAAFRVIAAGAAAHLRPGGRVIVEHGAGQGAAVAQIFRDAGFCGIVSVRDLDGRARVLGARTSAAGRP